MRMALYPSTTQDIRLLDLVMFKHLYGRWLAAFSVEEAEIQVRRFVQRRRRSWPYANADEVVLVCRTHFERS